MTTSIYGKVAKLINSNELVLNRGAEAGIRTGWKVWIFDESIAEIKDPDTGEDLGQIPRYAAQLDIVNVGPRASIARRRPNPYTAYLELINSRVNAVQSPRQKEIEADLESWPEGVRVGSRFIAQGEPE
jgi:hypothetical protein